MTRARSYSPRQRAAVAAFTLFLSLALTPTVQAQIVIQGSAGFIQKIEDCLEKIAGTKGKPSSNLSQLTNSSNIHTIKESSTNGCSPSNGADATNGTGTGSTTQIDPNFTGDVGGGVKGELCANLTHELDHAKHNDSGDNDFTSTGHNGIPTAEIEACSTENEYRAGNGLPTRTHYGSAALP